LKIVHIVPALTKGGGERVAVDLANEAARRGHDVTMVAVTRVDESILREKLQPRVKVVYMTSANGRLSRYFKAVAWCMRNPTLREADVVHCHMTISSAIATLLYVSRAVRQRPKPLVIETYHAVGMPIPRWHRWIHAQFAKRRDGLALMAEDPFWNAFAERQSGAVIRKIPNGVAADSAPVPAQERLAFRRAVGISEACPLVVGTIGRLDPARQPWLYAKVFKPIADRFPEAEFLIGGAGPELERVQQSIADEGLSGRVHLPGLVREPRVAFSNIDLYVTINVGPTTGIAAIEAVFAGVPVIAIQLLPGYQGRPSDWIWSGELPSEVGEHAVSILSDRERLHAVAEAQRKHANTWHSAEAMADAYDELYSAARSARRSGHDSAD
jgi:glycosyltransferase involved in cell wall biosynthesis